MLTEVGDRGYGPPNHAYYIVQIQPSVRHVEAFFFRDVTAKPVFTSSSAFYCDDAFFVLIYI